MNVKDLPDDELWRRFMDLSQLHGEAARAFDHRWGDSINEPLDSEDHPQHWPASEREEMERARESLLAMAKEFLEAATEVFRRRLSPLPRGQHGPTADYGEG